MSKKILFRLAVILTVLVLVYGMFWFFKVGQVEKQINNFIAANGANVLVSKVSVSGFPLVQKISINDLKFTIPNLLINKKQVVIKNVVLTSKILSSEFTASFPEAPTLLDIDGNVYNVEFNSDPEIKISFVNGRIAKLAYRDSGYRVTDAQKNSIYAASSSVVDFESQEESDGKIIAKVTSEVKDIEGFGIVEVYKNAFEKSLMEGIKTGAVIIGNGSTAPALSLPSSAAPNANVSTNSVDGSSPAVSNPVSNVTPVVQAAAQNVAPATDVSNSSPSTQASVTNPSSAQPVAAESVTSVPDNGLIKSNFVLNVEYTLTPVEAKKEEESGQLPQLQATQNYQYNKATKITNLEFSNPLYRVTINGEVNNLSDDELPSGSIAVKVENVSNLVDYVKLAIEQMIDPSKSIAVTSAPVIAANVASDSSATSASNSQQQASSAPAADASSSVASAAPAPAVASAPSNTVDLVATTAQVVAPAVVVEDPYINFLKRVSTSLPAIVQEISAKNAVSKDKVAQFDIRREKNLEFLVNEVSLHEILGKM